MAKDGTCRGGPRLGLGRPSKALKDKITEGKAANALVLPSPVEFEGEDIPEPKDYMLDEQKGGEKLRAREVFRETYLWLKARGCEKLVSRQLLDQYAMDVARWFQCQRAISQFGFLAKHPTTGAAIASPYVAMSREFSKQMNANWYQIYQVVRDNCSVEYGSTAPHEDDFMENRILTLGSLFYGSGGFPLGGLLSGIKPLWASEIEPFPIRVTTRRFPEMKHLEDISGIKGSEIDPVDIITFGSP